MAKEKPEKCPKCGRGYNGGRGYYQEYENCYGCGYSANYTDNGRQRKGASDG